MHFNSWTLAGSSAHMEEVQGIRCPRCEGDDQSLALGMGNCQVCEVRQ